MSDHLLHYAPGDEGYGAWRLECTHSMGEQWMTYVEPTVRPAPCHCLAAGNDCEDCQADDHGACGFDTIYVYELGPSCLLTPQPDVCWVADWWGEVGAESLDGDDWPEDAFPYPVDCSSEGDGLIVRYAPTSGS